ncbi:MAG TPA: LPS export ABC transporter periplasmic protein LptC [Stenotrophomonas sp.]|nr:LPS export ABC transporter periplasmic protein LptC [Stenotrophomonas sp.]
MSRRLLIGTALLLAALLSGWFAWRNRSHPVEQVAAESSADYVLHDFELISLDKDSGKEAITLRAPEAHRNRADQTMDITTPLFLLPDQQGLPWTLRARTGWVSAKADELRLRGDVAGDSPAAPGVVPTTFRTTALDVFPQQHLARTAERVTMTRPGLSQTGVGFEANLQTRQYKLLSQVKTRYEPNTAR